MRWRYWRIFLVLLVLGWPAAGSSTVFYVTAIIAPSVDEKSGTDKHDKLACREGAEIHRDQCVSVCQFGALGVFSSERECHGGPLSWVAGACVGAFAFVIWLFIVLKITIRKKIKYDE